MKKFTTELSPKTARIVGGFGASNGFDPSKLADEVFNGAPCGAWLCCYMIRRFGWPNSGSDDYKELCSWTLTTPIKGLYLGVGPYLGGSNLHFSVRFNDQIQREIRKEPWRDAHFERRKKVTLRWWKNTGRKLYSFGYGKKTGDEDEIIHLYGEIPGKPGYVYALWRKAGGAHPRRDSLPKRNIVLHWLADFIKDKYPEVRFPAFPKIERRPRHTRFQIAMQFALKAALRDLMRPTNVRDIYFTPFGDVDRTPDSVKRYSDQPAVAYFKDAGYAPSYLYGRGRKKLR